MIKKFISAVLVISVIFFNFGFLLAPSKLIAAGTITAFSDTLSNLTASTAADHTIKFTTPSGVSVGQTIVINFDAGLSMGGVGFGDIDLLDDGVDIPLAASPSGNIWGANVTGQDLTLTNGASNPVAAGSVITIKIGKNASSGVNQISNGAAGSKIIRVSGSFSDIGSLALVIVPNSIVVVSAEVTSNLNFSVSSNALYFGNLSTSTHCFARNTVVGYIPCPVTAEAEAFNMVAGTNGATGYSISVSGPSLTSGANTITAPTTNTVPAIGTEQFGMRVTASGGSGSVTAPYAAAGFAYNGVASPSQVASSSIPSANTTYSVRYLANISAITKSGSYTTNHTYVATGNF